MVSPEALLELPVSTSTIKNDLIPFYANFYGIPVQEIQDITKCESNYSEYQNGDYVDGLPTSFGVAQLHNPLSKVSKQYPQGITIPEAYNAIFSLNYMAQSLKNGTDHWSCQKITGWI